jgi:hypothetical protein
MSMKRGTELEADREVAMPFVRRTAGADPVAEFGVDKGGRRAEGEVPARKQPPLPRPAGVSFLGGRGSVAGAGNKNRRLA